MTACTQSTGETSPLEEPQTPVGETVPAPPVEQRPEEEPAPELAAPATERDYVLETYTEEPNEKSRISIQYPRFADADMEPLNRRIYEEVESFIHEPLSMYGEETGITIEYQSCVTLQNSRVASIVFWGWSEVERSAHPFTDLRPLNIDLATMEELELRDLYTVGTGFKRAYRDKACFPGEPVTSFDEEYFQEMLPLVQADLRLLDYARCFLKPDGLVVSTTSAHATGCDHFEAMLRYEDVAECYLPEEVYWEDGPDLPTLAELRAAEPVPDNGVGYTDYWLLAELPEHDIALYCVNDGGSVEYGEDMEKCVFLRAGDWVQSFRQSHLTPRMIPPEMYYEDLDGDGERELGVIYDVGSGTGCSVEELVVYEQTGGIWYNYQHAPRALIESFNADRIYEPDQERKTARIAYGGAEAEVDLTVPMLKNPDEELEECRITGLQIGYTWDDGKLFLCLRGEINPQGATETLNYAFSYNCSVTYHADGTFTEGTGWIDGLSK